MSKKTKSEMYAERGKSKVMKMKDDLHDIDDIDDICDMDDELDDDMDDMCDMENKKCMTGMDKDMDAELPECILLAHSYVPWQYYEQAFTPSEALMKGTLFPELWGVYPIPK
ncbi:MAG: hypothetical protein K0R22_2725 [Sporomusa sp.]|nr:hypothetical protein [Sporomusa sp.]